MKVILSVVLTAMAVLVIGVSVWSSDKEPDKGAENIEMDGGRSGRVPFPHHRHQKTLGDCAICHSVFPQEAGSIEALKANGQIAKKHVMNKLCTKCHKEEKKAGRQSGPTTCTTCHVKGES